MIEFIIQELVNLKASLSSNKKGRPANLIGVRILLLKTIEHRWMY